MYFTLIMFNMMGYVVYQYHHMLGVSIKDPVQRNQALPDTSTENALIGELIAEREDCLFSHVRRYLPPLLKKNQGEKALALYRTLHEQGTTKEASFAPEIPAQWLRLAEAARQRRDFTAALGFIKSYDKRFLRDPEIPAVYLFAAQLLSENLRQDDSAQKILAVLLERYPTHAVSTEAKQLLTVIENFARPTGVAASSK